VAIVRNAKTERAGRTRIRTGRDVRPEINASLVPSVGMENVKVAPTKSVVLAKFAMPIPGNAALTRNRTEFHAIMATCAFSDRSALMGFVRVAKPKHVIPARNVIRRVVLAFPFWDVALLFRVTSSPSTSTRQLMESRPSLANT
jgi:hypothetical protein